MIDQDFAQLVAEAIDALPEDFRDRLENVEVMVEEWPDPATIRLAGVRHRAELLGFYHGVPLANRPHDYGMVLPDRISIYRGPILLQGRNWQQVRRLTEHVLRHEIAHHFGISDERLREIGAY
jgi:predicted Zn-dependent protease with MMP-like domain